MSENLAGAKCSQRDWELALDAGLPFASTADELAIHRFAEAVRAEHPDALRYRYLRDHCYDTEPAGDGDSFPYPELAFWSDELEPYDASSLDGAIDSAIRNSEAAKALAA